MRENDNNDGGTDETYDCNVTHDCDEEDGGEHDSLSQLSCPYQWWFRLFLRFWF